MSNSIIDLLMSISEQLGRITVLQPDNVTPRLRKENRIRTIHSSLAIEHNSLSREQVTAIINGKKVLGNPNEIKEVQNAYQAYELMLSLDPYSMDDLLNAHRLMMRDLIKENGKFRSGAVGVYEGDRVIHDTLKDYEDNTDQVIDQGNDQVKIDNPNLIKLLGAIGDDTLSAVEIMKRIGLSHRPTFRKNYLNPALELDLIERTIPDKPNSRNQRYRKKQL